jgi:hypothetical protein
MYKRLGIVIVLIAMLVAAVQVSHTQAVTNHSGRALLSCTTVDINISYDVDRDNTGANREAHDYLVYDGAGTLIYWVAFQDWVPSSWHDVWIDPYDVAPAYNPITFLHVSYAGNGYPEQRLYQTSGWCDGLPQYAGPDMVPIPSTAVVGSFVTTTAIYFAPQADAASTIVMEAGKTAWVYGVDASGQFYKVMLSGQFFWVPVNTMGPNFDDVWQGRPLPTDVVS